MPQLKEKYNVVLLSSPGEDLDEAVARHQVKGIAVPMERHISVTKDIKALIKLIGVLYKERPQMVHSMTPKAGLLCMMAAWLTRVPVRVHTFTGLVWPTEKGLKRRILMATDWLTCACATHIIPEGEGVKNDLLNNGITKKPLRVLGYGNVRGIDLEKFSHRKEVLEKVTQISQISQIEKTSQTPQKPQITQITQIEKNSQIPQTTQISQIPQITQISQIAKGSQMFTFLFVGRIVGDKGINEMVNAFKRLNEAYKDTQLILVGWFEQQLDPVSEETRETIEQHPCIHAVGTKEGDELLAYYATADCFVFPSYREGFPNTVIEAGAMGLPCIVTDINGSREIIREGENGLIIPPRDEEALYSAMLRMMTDTKERQRMAGNARRMIAERYEQGYVRQCLLDYYEQILKD